MSYNVLSKIDVRNDYIYNLLTSRKMHFLNTTSKIEQCCSIILYDFRLQSENLSSNEILGSIIMNAII